MCQNNRVHGQKLRLNINFFNRISGSSLGSLKPKHLQQSFIAAIIDVLNTISKRTAKSSECSSALVSGQTSIPYKRTGIHFVVLVTRCRTTSSDAILPTLPNIALADR